MKYLTLLSLVFLFYSNGILSQSVQNVKGTVIDQDSARYVASSDTAARGMYMDEFKSSKEHESGWKVLMTTIIPVCPNELQSFLIESGTVTIRGVVDGGRK